jgi:hypothetical protein
MMVQDHGLARSSMITSVRSRRIPPARKLATPLVKGGKSDGPWRVARERLNSFDFRNTVPDSVFSRLKNAVQYGVLVEPS